MKRIATATVVISFLVVLNVMGQTTPTATSTPAVTPAATPAAKPAAKPTESSIAKPAAKPVPKAVLYWDGTGPWQRPDGDAHAERFGDDRRDRDKWPSAVYEQRETEESGHDANVAREFAGTSQGSVDRLRCMGPERRPCREWEVNELSRRMVEKSNEHPVLASIRTLTLESSEGALSCQRVEGGHCTPEQLWSLNEHVAKPLRCTIYEVPLRPNSVSPSATAQNRAPTRSAEVSTTRHNESESEKSSPTAWNNESVSEKSTPTTSNNEFLTETSTSPAPTGTTVAAGGNSTTPHRNPTAQNHAPATAAHPAGWQHRTAATPSHTTVPASQGSTPPKQ